MKRPNSKLDKYIRKGSQPNYTTFQYRPYRFTITCHFGEEVKEFHNEFIKILDADNSYFKNLMNSMSKWEKQNIKYIGNFGYGRRNNTHTITTW